MSVTIEQVAFWRKISSPYTRVRKPWKRDQPLGAGYSRATALALGLKPESKLAPSAGPFLTSSSMQPLVLYILMHTRSVHADSCVQYIYVNTHAHTTGTCKHGQHAYRHTCVQSTYIHVHTHANTSSMHKDMCAYAHKSTCIHSGTNTPSTHVDGGVCNTGICVHAHTKTHENT